MTNRVFGFGLLAVMLAHHWGLWLALSVARDLPLLDLINQWDAGLYTTIVQDGPSGALWAFFPLYPLVVKLAWWATGLAPAILGCVISSAALATFVWVATKTTTHSKWGLFLVLYGPASFVLHSHHTEGLFLLFSCLALTFASQSRMLPAVAFTALSMWTRNQGALVGITVLLLLKHKRVAAVLMLLAGLAFLGFEYARSGDAFIFLHSQGNWTHATSAGDVVRALWLGNPWQNTSTGSFHRLGWMVLWLMLAVLQFRQERALGSYALLSLVPLFLQAEFVTTFRFGAVVYSLWFWAGDRLALAPKWAQGVVVVALIALNHLTTMRYALGLWAY